MTDPIDEVREKYGFTQEEIKTLHVVNPTKTVLVSSQAKTKAQTIADLNDRIKTAIRNRRIVDGNQDIMLLEHPLESDKTPIEIRKAFLIQSQITHYWLWEADVDEEPDDEVITDLLYPEDICPKCYRFVENTTCPYCGAKGIVLSESVRKSSLPQRISRPIQKGEKVANPWM